VQVSPPIPQDGWRTACPWAPCCGLARCSGHDHNDGPAAAGRQQQPGHHAHEGLAVGKPRLGPAQVLVHDFWHPAVGDAGVFCLALLISDLSPFPSLLGMHGFHIGDKGVQAQALGITQVATAAVTAMTTVTATAFGASRGQGGWNHHRGGHCHLMG
jgi:hypothetical protein